uniref:PROP1-like PPR domain-containing protein n=1 Tax=Auxenochlorella protothecoides TaxID=3075 RepID=A0A1D1ZUL0_AUXPR
MARTEGTGLRRVLQSLQARILSPERTAWYSTSLADNIVPAEALPRLAERIKKNAAYGRSSMVAADLEVYLARGGEIKPAIVSALFNMYARLRSPEKGDALYARVQAHRQGPMTPANYASLLNVYAKAEHPPYGVPRRWAIRAAQVAQEALDAGVVPGLAFMHSLMECQAKAGLPEAALATYHQLLRKGLQPTPRTFNILLLAHRRSGTSRGAAHVFEDLLPKAGVTRTLAVWNSYLGVYAVAGDIDRAYHVWTCMLAEGIVPDHFTERVLVQAFSARPSLAAEVLDEARQLRTSSHAAGHRSSSHAGAPSGEAAATPASSANNVARQPPMALEQPSRRSLSPLLLHGHLGQGADPSKPPARQLLYIDLHGVSRAAAATLLHRRLELLVAAWPALRAELGDGGPRDEAAASHGDGTGESEAAEGPPAAAGCAPLEYAGLQTGTPERPRALLVVTGVGHGSPESQGVLRGLTRDILGAQGLECHDAGGNTGRTVVPWSSLAPFLSRHHTRAQAGYLARAARARYALVLMGSMTLVGAGLLVPRLAPWLA